MRQAEGLALGKQPLREELGLGVTPNRMDKSLRAKGLAESWGSGRATEKGGRGMETCPALPVGISPYRRGQVHKQGLGWK